MPKTVTGATSCFWVARVTGVPGGVHFRSKTVTGATSWFCRHRRLTFLYTVWETVIFGMIALGSTGNVSVRVLITLLLCAKKYWQFQNWHRRIQWKNLKYLIIHIWLQNKWQGARLLTIQARSINKIFKINIKWIIHYAHDCRSIFQFYLNFTKHKNDCDWTIEGFDELFETSNVWILRRSLNRTIIRTIV